MHTIFLVRHAEPASFWSGSDSNRPLSDEGRRQAQQTGRMLRDSGATELRTAPHRRCVETAELIGRALGLKPVIDESLHMAKAFDLAVPDGAAIWVAHSNNIPGALRRAGIECHACGHAAVWRIDFTESGEVANADYSEP